MIIACPNCNKKFKIDPTLIPEDGRDLKCGSCNHVWLYKIEDLSSMPLTLNKNIYDNKFAPNEVEKENDYEFDKITEITKEEKSAKKFIEKQKSPSENKEKNTGSKFFSYLVVFMISSVALVILLDTLKTPLIIVFPNLEIVLFNLFETLKDIKLFIIDLY